MDATLVETRSSLKAVCARKDLFDGVQTVGHAVSGRTSLPILNHVLLQTEEGALNVMASDTELSIALSIPAQVQEHGGLTAPARLLTELLGSLPEAEVAVSVDRSHAAHIHCDRSAYKILGLPAEEYPRLPEVKAENRFSIPQRRLREMIRKTIFAVSQDEARAILTGVLLVLEPDKLTLVATDTHRLAIRSTALSDTQGAIQVIVPARAMNELLRILEDEDGDVQVQISDNQALFRTPAPDGKKGVTLISNLIQGQFPNYHRVVPTSYVRKLVIQTASFQKAIRRASIVARNNAHRVILRTQDDKLSISAENSMEGSAYEEVELVREGDDIEIAFNAKYLLDVLGVLDEDGFQLELTESLRPGLLRPMPAVEVSDGSEYTCILMPMQIV